MSEIIILILLLFLSAFFSGSETAFFNLRTYRDIPEKIDAMLQNSRKLLVTILLGNTLVNVAIGSIMAHITYSYTQDNTFLLIEVIVVSLVIIIFGELLPKTIAIRMSEKIALLVYLPIKIIMKVLTPLTWLFHQISELVIKILPIQVEKVFDSDEELEMLAEVGEEEGTLDEEESDMLRSIIKFDDKTVKEIMTPRVDMVALPTSSSIDDLMDCVAEKYYSKIPIFKSNIDDIKGVVYAKDLAPYLIGSRPHIDMVSISRQAYFVPESKPIDDLLNEFRKMRMSIAIVVDEWGGTSGMITLEDIVEEVIGEIRDPYDIEIEPIVKLKDNNYIIDGKIAIYDLEDEFDIKFPEEREYDTLAGFILDELEDIPKAGESVSFGDMRFIVREVDGNRILKVEMVKL